MIVSRIIGGLGNQLFQYATGRALAKRQNTGHAIDISGFEDYDLHEFQLDKVFDNLEYSECRRGMPIYNEPRFGYDELPAQDNMYLNGYFQSAKYFDDIREDLIKDIGVPKKNKGIAVHVRRGDFLNKGTIEKHGVLNIGYYDVALAQYKDLSKVRFFTDDVEWVKDAFNSSNVQPKGDAVQDLRAFSSYEHQIIANSSYGWWGAWLNQNPDKKVVAPLHWFAGFFVSSDDLLPKEWIKL